jgi:hypothetical protein
MTLDVKHEFIIITMKMTVFWDVSPCSLVESSCKTLIFILVAVRT